MATITKTYKDDLQDENTKATWTFTFTGTNATATGATVSVAVPTITAKYVRTSGSKAGAYVEDAALRVGSVVSAAINWSLAEQSWATGVTKTLAKSPSSVSFNTGSIFTSSNKTTKTVNVVLGAKSGELLVGGTDYIGNSKDNGFEAYPTSIGTIATITLNAPPTCTASPSSSGDYYAGISAYSVNVTEATAYYGGDISSIVLNVGGVTASRTNDGALSVTVPSASGSYTPTVTITDSRGQTNTYSLTAITVEPHTLPTLTPTVTSSAPYYNIGTTYSVTVSDITAYDGATISSITLRIGSQEDVKTAPFTNPFNISPNTVGQFMPQIIITDSYGATNTISLSDITVLRYDIPSVNFNVIRTDENGVKNDEGESAIITATFIWTSAVARLTAPTVVVKDLDENVQYSVTTWYESWTSTGGVANAISDWSRVSNMPIYGLVKNTTTPTPDLFNLNNSYYISVTANDDIPSIGTTQTQTLGSAFYTVDFRAGGHGIAFGQPALQDGFYCNMEAHFVDADDVMRALFDFIHPVGSYYETSDTSFNPNTTWGGTWVLETEGLVHISAGTNYAVNGATTDTQDGGSPYIQKHTHAFTQPTVPNHSHTSSGGAHTHVQRGWLGAAAGGKEMRARKDISGDPQEAGALISSGAHSHTIGGGTCTTSGGAVGAVSGATTGNEGNMMPYIIVNRWHRTA